MKEAFVTKDFRAETLDLIELCSEIIDDYTAQGYDLTTRQLYYRLVAGDIVPNTQRSYSRVAGIIADARLAGLLDWEAIVDRTRGVKELAHWNNPAEILRVAEEQYRIDRWKDQGVAVYVACEKQAGEGILEPLCRELDVPFIAMRGYSSASHLYRLAKRIRRDMKEGKSVWLFYAGDHDPSGLDMDRDIESRLFMFSNVDLKRWEKSFSFYRVALTMDQIEQFGPPPNPAKITDSRAKNYIRRYGHESWELDALEPAVLSGLVRASVVCLLDADVLEGTLDREERERGKLARVREEFEKGER
jgi:hypothetical protein